MLHYHLLLSLTPSQLRNLTRMFSFFRRVGRSISRRNVPGSSTRMAARPDQIRRTSNTGRFMNEKKYAAHSSKSTSRSRSRHTAGAGLAVTKAWCDASNIFWMSGYWRRRWSRPYAKDYVEQRGGVGGTEAGVRHGVEFR